MRSWLKPTWSRIAWLFFVPIVIGVIVTGAGWFIWPDARFPVWGGDAGWVWLFGGIFAALPLLAVILRGWLLWAGLALGVAGLVLLPAGLSPSGGALWVSLWLGLVAYLVGDELLARFKFANLTRGERFGLALAAGYAALMLIATLLGFLGLVYPALAWIILILFTLWLLPQRLRRLWLARAFDWRAHLRGLGERRFGAWGLAALVVCGVGAYLWALAPAVRWDSLSYHVPVPLLAIQEHAITPMPESIQSYWAHYAETLYTLGMLITPSTALPGLLHFQMGLLTTLLTFCLGRKLNGNSLQGLLAALLFWSLPMVQVEAGSAYIDLFVSAMAGAMLLCAWFSFEQRRDAWLGLAGVFAGMMVGVKLSGIFLGVGLGLGILLHQVRERAGLGVILKKLLIFGGGAGLLLAPWLLRDWLWTGNPIFPNYNQIFHSPLALENILSFELKPDSDRLAQILTLPQSLLANSAGYYHELPGFALGGLAIFCLPWLYPWCSKRDKRLAILALAGFGLVSLGLSLQVSSNLRYLICVLPVFCILSAENLLILWEAPPPGWPRALAWGAAVVLGSAYLFAGQLVLIVRHTEISERYPYRYALGQESQAEFLTRTVLNYPAYRFLEQRYPPPLKILSVGSELRLYTSAKIYAPMYSSEAYRLLHAPLSREELFEQLKALNYTHLLFYLPEIAYRPRVYAHPVIDDEFFYRYTRPVYTQNQLSIYELVDPQAGAPEPVNLLTNSGLDTFDAGGLPEKWEIYGEFEVSSDGKSAHSGSGAIRLAGMGRGSAFQNVPAVPGQIYAVSYWAQPEQGGQLLPIYVQWLDRNGQLLTQAAEWVDLKPGWNHYQRLFTAPEGAAYARFVVTTGAPGRTWFDDLCLTSGGLCR